MNIEKADVSRFASWMWGLFLAVWLGTFIPGNPWSPIWILSIVGAVVISMIFTVLFWLLEYWRMGVGHE